MNKTIVEVTLMKLLSQEAFNQSAAFLKTQARPLERALFAYHFESGSADAVWAELARFQNEDGGYGHALEPDLRTPSSSALATGHALALLADLDCPPNHPLVSRAVDYLLQTFDANARAWRVTPPDTHEHPHAPWWHDEDGSLARTFDHFRIIPRAYLLASLWHYARLAPAGWLADLTEETVSYIEQAQVFGEGGGSDLEYSIRLAEARNLPQHQSERLKKRALKAIPAAVVREPHRWNTYCITPLRVVQTPGGLGAGLIPEALQMHLDYQVMHQAADGAWDPTWSWSGAYPAAWEMARREWRGKLTLEMLQILRAFGRLA